MLPRTEYLERLIRWKDKDLVKVVTGIRRCGKSTLLALYREYLGKHGVSARQIQTINLEEEANTFADWRALHRHIEKHFAAGRKNYVFLDEIQQIRGAQKLLASLRLRKGVDIYVTGSNAYLLSSELATLLAGRYIEIQMLPLSFQEYVSACGKRASQDALFQDYLLNSSFPQTLEFGRDLKLIQDYIEGIYHTIVQKDIVLRQGLKDISRLDSVASFMFDNIGSETSLKNISNTMTSAGRKIHPQTVETYLNGLLESYVLYKIARYDVKGRQYLLTNAKYYLADIGLRYALLGNKGADAGHILENVVCLELLRRGYKVYVGKVQEQEVDFVASLPGGKIEYYQAAQSVLDKKTLERELKPLLSVKDSYPKFLLTRDYTNCFHQGIRQINALDWLLGKE
ncbi:putative ATPase [Candidatus Termititenax aidoneus]|uniref:ATPase n=1 Tax=Termititenax aidoneus TaxID=2218524 RepID=A0A388T7I9_TERA1|nr:putative ATPase [Candidatus Termititenax aidoneus]